MREKHVGPIIHSYFDVDRKKVGESSYYSDEQIADLFYVVQEYERRTYRSNST
jgi:uncharacterized protein YutE (UPF0331/DUF86 family)